ncbi:hypothetical protein [Aquicoccus porphyridii]|uniref:hypothetical protein n=1 Tax=Aquicoccus porphyridii TaxID=1852029 RepID=UPI00273E79B2|nr:hypothetical protein [Aquicoccus porphyridii]
MTLTLLHTSPVHVATFDVLRDRIAPGARLCHVVREDLLARARADGVAAVTGETQALIGSVAGPVLCTCTTLGEVAEAAGATRIDRPMMRAAAARRGRVLMVYCLESTEAPSRALLCEEMERAGNRAGFEPLFLGAAWPLFEAGDTEGFAHRVAQEICAALEPGFGAVVLAQASMAGAAARMGHIGLPILASPETALRTALCGDRSARRG